MTPFSLNLWVVRQTVPPREAVGPVRFDAF